MSTRVARTARDHCLAPSRVDETADIDSRVPAVWPFFGQFLAHDLTADRSPLVHRARPPVCNFRTPRANLEGVALIGDPRNDVQLFTTNCWWRSSSSTTGWSSGCAATSWDHNSGTVPATLSLTLGTPATFGAFTPGVDKSYDASTTATSSPRRATRR